MEAFDGLLLGIGALLDVRVIAYCLLGVTVGTFIGVLPGIGSLAAVSMLLPISFYLDPMTAIILLGGVYYGAEYGGSTAAILLNLPGTPSSAVTCLDGYPMSQQGRAGVALFITTIASFFGCMFGILALIAFGPALGKLAMSFGPAEYLSLITLGLIAASTIVEGNPVKSLIMVFAGLLLGSVGIDPTSGTQRFTFGSIHLFDGINIVVVAMGLFGVSELILAFRSAHVRPTFVSFRSMLPSRDDIVTSVLPILRGSLVGGFFGALPGVGQTTASFVSYAVEKRVSRSPERFGKGAIEGVASPEAANNAAVQCAFIPTLTLGVPGSATMALMMGALLIHGVTPGPNLLNENAPIFWGVVASFFLGNLFLLILNIPLINLWVRILAIPYHFLYPLVLFFVCIGVYSVEFSSFDVLMLVVFGLLGLYGKIHGYEPAPLILGFVLGPMMEENFRRAMMLARGDFSYILYRPLSAAMLLLSLFLIGFTIVRAIRNGGREHLQISRSESSTN